MKLKSDLTYRTNFWDELYHPRKAVYKDWGRLIPRGRGVDMAMVTIG
jgi:hypothetical protein